MRKRNRSQDFGEELRTGSAGVPLAVADEYHRRVIINREPPKITARKMGLSDEVCTRLLMLLKRHGLPSRDRLILLSVGYPERSYSEIASAFSVTVDYVNDVVLRAASLRKREPLSTELWEDITEETMMPDEVYARAAEVRRINALVEGAVLGFAEDGSPVRAGVRRRATLPWNRCRARQESCVAGPQSAEGLLSELGCNWDGELGDQDEELDVHCPF